MTKIKHISDAKFACVAEAVAHFHAQGFTTFDMGEGTNQRIMRNDDREVMIVHRGLLDVDATLIQIIEA